MHIINILAVMSNYKSKLRPVADKQLFSFFRENSECLCALCALLVCPASSYETRQVFMDVINKIVQAGSAANEYQRNLEIVCI